MASASPSYTIQTIGLTAANTGGVNESNGPVQVNAAGQVIGTSERFDSSNNTYDLGGDAWFFDGNSTRQIGFIGANYGYAMTGGTYENTTIAQLNGAGEVIGQSQRFSDTGVFLGWDGWIYNGGPTQEIGLTGLSYSYATSSGTFEQGGPTQLNADGEVIGDSARYSSSGGSLGGDSWIYNGSTTQQVGLIGPNYSYAASGGTYESSVPVQINAAGEVSGQMNRYSSSGISLGVDSWIFNGSSTQQIGLIGTNYSYATANGIEESSYNEELNDAGEVLGDSARVGSSGASLGQDAWIYNGSSTQRIGLTGTPYSYAVSGGTYQDSDPGQLSAAGQATGYSVRYNSSGTSLGNDSWIYNGSST